MKEKRVYLLSVMRKDWIQDIGVISKEELKKKAGDDAKERSALAEILRGVPDEYGGVYISKEKLPENNQGKKILKFPGIRDGVEIPKGENGIRIGIREFKFIKIEELRQK